MKILIASVLSIIFMFLTAMHIYWAFGGKNLSVAVVPTKQNNKPVIRPRLFDCLAVAMALTAFGVFVLTKAGIILFNLPGWLLNYGLWAIAAIFILRAIGEFNYVGFFKKIKTTRFGQMDTMYFSPLCLLIGVLMIILALIN